MGALLTELGDGLSGIPELGLDHLDLLLHRRRPRDRLLNRVSESGEEEEAAELAPADKILAFIDSPNLVTQLTPEQLAEIGSKAIDGYRRDDGSREDWKKLNEQGMKRDQGVPIDAWMRTGGRPMNDAMSQNPQQQQHAQPEVITLVAVERGFYQGEMVDRPPSRMITRRFHCWAPFRDRHSSRNMKPRAFSPSS